MKKLLTLGGATLLTLMTPSLTQAASYYWDTSTSTWNTGANWSNTSTSGGTTGTLPGTSDTAVFNQSSVNGAETVYLNGARSIGGMTFQNTGATTLLGGVSGTPAANTLTLSGGMTVSAGAGTVTIGDTSGTPTAQVNLALSATQSFTNNSSSLLTIANGVTSSASTGTQTLTLAGAIGNIAVNGAIGNGSTGGTLALAVSGTTGTVTLASANGYTGGTTIGSGTLVVTNTTGLGVNTTSTAIALNGGTLSLLNDGSGSNGTIVYGASPGYNVSVTHASVINVDHNTTANTGNTIQLGGLTDSSTLTFTNGDGYNLSFAGNGSFSSSPVMTNNMTSGTVTFANLTDTDTTSSRTLTFNGNSSTAVTSVGTITPGTGTNVLSLVVAGLGTVQLTGTNTYTGSTTVSSGTLSLANATGAAVAASALALNGGTLSDVGASATAPGFTSTALDYGTNTVSTSSATGHVLALGAITRTTSEYGVVNFSPYSSSGAGSITTTTLNDSLNILGGWATVGGANWAVETGGTISAYSGYTTLNITTGTQTTTNYQLLNGSGTTTLSGALSIGSLKITTSGTTDAMSTASGSLTVNGSSGAGGILLTGGGTYTISGAGVVTGGTSTSSELIINVNSGSTLAISAPVISTGSASGSLTKAGTGTLSITSTANTYQQATTIDGGVLAVNDLANAGTASSIGVGTAGTNSAADLTLDGGTLEYTGANTSTNRAFTLGSNGGGLNASGSGTVTFSGNMTSSTTTAGTETLTLSGNNTGANTLGGVLANGASINLTAVTKTGTGTWVLGGVNTYTGATTISQGTLSVTGSTAAGSAVTVASGATLAGTGTVSGAVTLASGANINLVDGATGTLTVGSLSTTGGALTFEIGTSTGSIDKIAAGTLTIGSGSTTITIDNLNNAGSQSLATGSYTLLTYTNSTLPTNIGNLSLSTTSLDGDTLSLSTSTLGSVILTVTSSVSNGQYTLTTTPTSLIVHAGGTTTLSTTIKNTGTGTQDTLGYSNLTATVGSGSVGTGTNTSGSALAQGATGTADTQTFTASSTAGNVTVGNSATVNNTTASGTPVATNVGATINVYSGQSTWTATGTSGSWGTVAGTTTEVFGGNWGTNQGSPGLDTGFTGVDTATFGTVAGGSSTDTVNLNAAAPNLNKITFNSSTTSYTIAQGTGSNSITLSGTTPSINVTAGSHAISAPVVLGAATSLAVSSGDGLTVSGKISGGYALSNTGAGTTILSSSTGNSYSGGTTVSTGKFYVNSGTSGSTSGTGSGAVTVNGGTLAGSGSITTSSGVTVNTGGTLASGDVQSGTSVDGTHLTMSSTNVTIASANLTFDLGANNNGGNAGSFYNFASPNNNTTYLSLTGTSTIDFTGTDSVTLVDLTNTNGSNGSLALRLATPYLLISAGSNADYLNLVINSGTLAHPIYSLSQADGGSTPVNGYVVGVYIGSGLVDAADSTPISIAQYGANGMTALTPGANGTYAAPALYLDGGQLEVVPEPGTWALMIGGLALLVFIQRRRNKLG